MQKIINSNGKIRATIQMNSYIFGHWFCPVRKTGLQCSLRHIMYYYFKKTVFLSLKIANFNRGTFNKKP
jgi:hypothetical protein